MGTQKIITVLCISTIIIQNVTKENGKTFSHLYIDIKQILSFLAHLDIFYCSKKVLKSTLLRAITLVFPYLCFVSVWFVGSTSEFPSIESGRIDEYIKSNMVG